MNTSKNQTVNINLPHEPYRFTKRLGSTTFTVTVYSSRINGESPSDKIARLIRNDAALGKAANQ